MVRYAYRIVGDMDDANDCVQDTLVKLLRAPTALETVAPGYCFAVLRNTCFDLVASRKRQDHLLGRHAQTPADSGTWIETIVTQAEWEFLLSMLPPGTRRVLVLLAEGHKHRDIAAQLGISTKTVAAHREKARQMMRRRHASPQDRERERERELLRFRGCFLVWAVLTMTTAEASLRSDRYQRGSAFLPGRGRL
jgi:RNA polymerase sigma factor (sigma-70 family)